MTMSRVEVITSVERRRHWPRAEKERLVGLSLEPGASVSDIARSAGLHVSQLFRWRKQLCERIAPEGPAPADGVVTITPAQMGYLLSGIDWRNPVETWRPTAIG